MTKVQITFTVPEEKEHDVRGFLRAVGVENISIKMLSATPPPPAQTTPPVVIDTKAVVGAKQPVNKGKAREDRERAVMNSNGTLQVLRILLGKPFATEEELRRAFVAVKSKVGHNYSSGTFFSYLTVLISMNYVRLMESGNYQLNREKLDELKKQYGWDLKAV